MTIRARRRRWAWLATHPRAVSGARGSSTPRTGTGCLTGAPGPPPSMTWTGPTGSDAPARPRVPAHVAKAMTVQVGVRPLTDYATAGGTGAVMSELTTNRIRTTAKRFGLTHLPSRSPPSPTGGGRPAGLPRLRRPGPRRRTRPARGPPVPQRPEALRPAAPQDPRRVRLHLPTRPRTEADQGPGHPGVPRTRANVALLGPPGTGKTHIAVALAVAACAAGYSIYFTSLDDLVRKLRTAEATGRFNRQAQRLPATLGPRR